MAFRKLAAAAALLAVATPAPAFDPAEAGATTLFYVSIPLEPGASRKQREWSVGLQLQGRNHEQAIRIDSKVLNAFSLNDIDAKWMIAGLVAAGAALAIGSKDKGTNAGLQQQQTQQQQAQASQPQGGGSGTCPRPPEDPCKR